MENVEQPGVDRSPQCPDPLAVDLQMRIQRPAAIAVQFDQRDPELAIPADRAVVFVVADQELASLRDRDFARVVLAMVIAEAKRADDLNVRVERRRDLLLGRGITEAERVFTKPELLRALWGVADRSKVRALDSRASRIRCKLREAGADGFVVNYRERGYTLCEGHAASNGGPQR